MENRLPHRLPKTETLRVAPTKSFSYSILTSEHLLDNNEWWQEEKQSCLAFDAPRAISENACHCMLVVA